MAVPADLPDVPCSDLVSPAQSIGLLSVTLHKGNKDDELGVLVQLSVVDKISNEPGTLQFHKAFQYGGEHGVEILSLDVTFLILISSSSLLPAS